MSSMDVIIIVTFASMFILLGVLMPFVQEGLNEPINSYDTDALEGEMLDDAQGGDISLGTLIVSVIKMFTWTFGDLPFILDAVFTIFRFAFFVAIVRTVRGI